MQLCVVLLLNGLSCSTRQNHRHVDGSMACTIKMLDHGDPGVGSHIEDLAKNIMTKSNVSSK